jgi:hypothetical protein
MTPMIKIKERRSAVKWCNHEEVSVGPALADNYLGLPTPLVHEQ